MSKYFLLDPQSQESYNRSRSDDVIINFLGRALRPACPITITGLLLEHSNKTLVNVNI